MPPPFWHNYNFEQLQLEKRQAKKSKQISISITSVSSSINFKIDCCSTFLIKDTLQNQVITPKLEQGHVIRGKLVRPLDLWNKPPSSVIPVLFSRLGSGSLLKFVQECTIPFKCIVIVDDPTHSISGVNDFIMHNTCDPLCNPITIVRCLPIDAGKLDHAAMQQMEVTVIGATNITCSNSTSKL